MIAILLAVFSVYTAPDAINAVAAVALQRHQVDCVARRSTGFDAARRELLEHAKQTSDPKTLGAAEQSVDAVIQQIGKDRFCLLWTRAVIDYEMRDQ